MPGLSEENEQRIRLLKYLLMIMNIAVFGCGSCLLGLSIWVVMSGYPTPDTGAHNPVYVIATAAGAIFIVCLLGQCAAGQQNRCLLGLYFSLTMFIFLLHLLGGALVLILQSQRLDAIKNGMRQHRPEIVEEWEAIQMKLNCCGLDGPVDWKSQVPVSCCGDLPRGVVCTTQRAHQTGCMKKVPPAFTVLAGAAFASLVIEVLAMILSFKLFHAVRDLR